MGHALGVLCFIMVVFSNSNVLDAMNNLGSMISRGAESRENGELNNYHIQERLWISMYIKHEGYFGGYLYHEPNSLADLHHEPHRLFLQLPNGWRLIADLEVLDIIGHENYVERLTESRYFINLGPRYSYCVSGEITPDVPGRILIRLHHYVASVPWHTDYHAELDYHEGHVPYWANEVRYRRVVEMRQEHLQGYHGGFVAGPPHVPNTVSNLGPMISHGADWENGESFNYHIHAGCWIAMYIINEGYYGGYLYDAPARRTDLRHAPHRAFVQLPDRSKLIADLDQLDIIGHENYSERLEASSYFVNLGPTFSYCVSNPIINQEPRTTARLMIRLHHYRHQPSSFVTLYGQISYHEGHVPYWADPARYYQCVENRLRNHGDSGAGPSHGYSGK